MTMAMRTLQPYLYTVLSDADVHLHTEVLISALSLQNSEVEDRMACL